MTQPHRLIGVGSLLIACLAGCTVRVERTETVDAAAVFREVVQALARNSGVEVTEASCPTELRAGARYTCRARTAIGEELIDVDVDHGGTATASWRRALSGGLTLAGRLRTLPSGRQHEFDCTGRVLVADDPTSVVVCPEVRREYAHIVVRAMGNHAWSSRYYEDVAGPVERAVGGEVSRIDCPSPEIVRGLAPFTCTVWRGDRVLEVTLTHVPEGWQHLARDVGPATGGE